MFLLIIAVTVHGIYVYGFKHKIDDRFTISYSKEGYRLIDTGHKLYESNFLENQSPVWRYFVTKFMPIGTELVSSPIVWYCVTQDHIIGCVGEEISDKPESYIPHCQINGHFIVNKSDSNTTNHLGSDAIDDFLKVNHAICDKINIY